MAAIQSGYVSNLSEDQAKALEAFRQKIGAANLDDHACLRFLRARKFNVDTAFTLFETAMHLRQKWNLDNLLDHPPQELLKLYHMLLPHAFHKFDKEGRPVYIQLTGAAHVDLLNSFTTQEQVTITHAYDMEMMCRRARDQSAALGRNIETFVNIVDCQGIGLKHMSFLGFLKSIASFDQECHPERLCRTFVINTPGFFSTVWSMITKFLDPVVASKVFVLGSNFQSTLLEYIDADSLPEQYGGKCRCGPDGGPCIAVTSNEQARTAFADFETTLQLAKHTVAARDAYVHRVPVLRASVQHPERVSWYFRTLKNDLKFGVSFEPSEEKASVEVVQAVAKVDCGTRPNSGSFVTKRPGTVLLTFDNTYSYLTSKTLRYSVSVLEEAEVPEHPE